MSRCPAMERHWFTVWGRTGLRSPVCMNCGAPNPRPLSDTGWATLVSYLSRHAVPNDDLIRAVRERVAAQKIAARKTRDILAEIEEQGDTG
jgi:hypothetical protein